MSYLPTTLFRIRLARLTLSATTATLFISPISKA